MVHGSGVDHRLLLPLDPVFEHASTWERIYVDLPGFGSTRPLPPPGGLVQLAQWLNAAVDTLIGDRRFAIVANSLGGLLARELAARRPAQVAALALLAPVVRPEAGLRRLPPREVVEIDQGLIDSLDADSAAAFCDMAVVQTGDGWQRFRTSALPGIRAADQRAAARLEKRYTLPGAPPEDRFGAFAGPALVITGRQDHVVGYADQLSLMDSYPNGTFVVLNRAGHNVHLEQPRSVRALLAAWQAEAAGTC